MMRDRKFREEDIVLSFKEFCQRVIDAIKAKNIHVNIMDFTFSLMLDDRSIDDKKDIDASDGRYFFKTKSDKYIPHASSPGVYFFFNKEKVALYVGKSDCDNGLGRRVWSHVGKKQNDQFPDLEFNDAEYVVTIPFKEASYLASAYEGFLLSKYNFKYNTQEQIRLT